jgi:hypothetical protein
MQVAPGSVLVTPASARRRHAVITRVAIVGGVVALHAVPTHSIATGPVICPFRRFTGLPCPGCGMTRSLSLAAHWHFGEAAHLHPLGPVLYVTLVGLAVALLASWAWSPRDVWERVRRTGSVRAASFAVFGGWMAWAIVRAIRVAVGHDPSW